MAKVLERTVEITDNNVVINETTETILNREDLEDQLNNIQRRKKRLQEENARLIEDYNKLLQEEIEINNLISQLSPSESPIEEL